MTVVNPPKVSEVAPNAIVVVPIVTELLVSELLPILLIVLDAPLIVLLVSVCVPVKVATVESMAMVTGVEPFKLVPDNPVPMVNALVVTAVTVVDPPRLTVFPLIVIELLAS